MKLSASDKLRKVLNIVKARCDRGEHIKMCELFRENKLAKDYVRIFYQLGIISKSNDTGRGPTTYSWNGLEIDESILTAAKIMYNEARRTDNLIRLGIMPPKK